MVVRFKETEINGDRVFVPVVNGHFLSGMVKLHYEQCITLDQYRFFEVAKSGMTILDIGASVGMAALQLVKLGVENIFSFEPNPIDRIALTALSHCFSQISVIDKAVFDRSGTIKMNVNKGIGGTQIIPNDDSDGLNTFIDRSDALKTSIEVETVTVDEFVKRNSLKIDVIKMDTEGCEKRVLTGAKETIRRDGPILLMSAYHRFEDPIVLPEVVRQIDSRYDVSEMLPIDEGREPVLRMKVEK